MARAQHTIDLLNKGLACEKAHNLRDAVRHFEEAVQCINEDIEDTQGKPYGSTGRNILKEKLPKYKKRLAKLKAKLRVEEKNQAVATNENLATNYPHDDISKRTTVVVGTGNVEVHSGRAYPRLVDLEDVPDSGGFDQVRSTSESTESIPIQDIFRPIPGLTDCEHLTTAINFAKKAVIADQENNTLDAIDLYTKGIEFYQLSINGELESKKHLGHVMLQVEFCKRRVEALRRLVYGPEAGENGIDNEGFDIDNKGYIEGDPDQFTVYDDTADATLQRRPVTKAQVIGHDVVRAILLNAAIGGTSFQRILLVGASGTGKTSLVQSLFKECVGFFYEYKDVSELSPVYDGDIKEAVVELFNDARHHKPSVIFLDKIDLLTQNGRLPREVSLDQHFNIQLQEQLIDSTGINENVVFISATDRPWNIHPNIRDRFDQVVYTSLPTIEDRIAIAKQNAQDLLHTLSEEDFVAIAHRTSGFTGADIECTMQKAVVFTINELHKATHFKNVQFGNETSTPAWTPCSSDDPLAVPMYWFDSVPIHPPEVTMKHVLDSLDDLVCSVSMAEEYRLRNWVLLTGKAPRDQIPILQQVLDHSLQAQEPNPTNPFIIFDNDVSKDMQSLSSITIETGTQTDQYSISLLDGQGSTRSTASLSFNFEEGNFLNTPMQDSNTGNAATIPDDLLIQSSIIGHPTEGHSGSVVTSMDGKDKEGGQPLEPTPDIDQNISISPTNKQQAIIEELTFFDEEVPTTDSFQIQLNEPSMNAPVTPSGPQRLPPQQQAAHVVTADDYLTQTDITHAEQTFQNEPPPLDDIPDVERLIVPGESQNETNSGITTSTPTKEPYRIQQEEEADISEINTEEAEQHDIVYVQSDMETFKRLSQVAKPSSQYLEKGEILYVTDDSETDDDDEDDDEEEEEEVEGEYKDKIKDEQEPGNMITKPQSEDTTAKPVNDFQVELQQVYASQSAVVPKEESPKKIASDEKSEELKHPSLTERLAAGVATGLAWDMSETMEENVTKGTIEMVLDESQEEPIEPILDNSVGLQREEVISEGKNLKESGHVTSELTEAKPGRLE